MSNHREKLIAYATEYVNLGYEILPVFIQPAETLRGTAQPKSPCPEWSAKRATSSVDVFTRGLDRLGELAIPIPIEAVGIAIVTTGILSVLDDDNDGKALRRHVERGDLDFGNSPIVRTPRGYHLYRRGLKDGKGAIALEKGLDLKASGGYVLVPPCVIDGKAYKWQQPLVPIDKLPPLPAFVQQEIRTRKRDRSLDMYSENPIDIAEAREEIEATLQQFDGVIVEGTRNDTTYRLCCRLADLGLHQDTARDLMEELFVPAIEGHFDITEPLQSSYKNRQSDIGSNSVEAMFSKVEGAEIPPPDADSAAYGVGSFDDAYALPPPDWIVEGLLTRGTPNAILARSGAHKTNTALSLAYHAALGLDFGPFAIPRALKVLYVDLEGRLGTTARMRAPVEANGGIRPPAHMWRHIGPFKAEKRFNLVEPEHVTAIARIATLHEIELIIIDTLTLAMAGLENDAQFMVRAAQWLNGLCDRTNATVLCLCHTPKTNELTIRGAGGFNDSMNTRATIEVHEGADPVAVALNAFHVKDGPSGRRVDLKDVSTESDSIALMPVDTVDAIGLSAFAKHCWTMINRSSRGYIMQDQAVRRPACPLPRDPARDAFKVMHGLAYGGGRFEIDGSKKRRLYWTQDREPTLEEMLS
jgi:hypothetical protein